MFSKKIVLSLAMFFTGTLFTSNNYIETYVKKLRTTYKNLLTEEEWNTALSQKSIQKALYFIYNVTEQKWFFISEEKLLKQQLLTQCKEPCPLSFC